MARLVEQVVRWLQRFDPQLILTTCQLCPFCCSLLLSLWMRCKIIKELYKCFFLLWLTTTVLNCISETGRCFELIITKHLLSSCQPFLMNLSLVNPKLFSFTARENCWSGPLLPVGFRKKKVILVNWEKNVFLLRETVQQLQYKVEKTANMHLIHHSRCNHEPLTTEIIQIQIMPNM